MQPRRLNYQLVVCGVNVAAGQSPLHFAESDAMGIYAAFTSALGPARPSTSHLRLGTDATRHAIAQALRAAAQTNPDCVLFYFSGHGAQNGIALADGLLDYNSLYKLLELSKTKKKLVILDACQSGAFAKYGQVEVGGIEDSWLIAIDEMMPGTRMFFAARATENSMEGGGVSGGHFTWSLLQGLHGAKGTLFVNGQSFVNDIDVFTAARTKLIAKWPNDAHPTCKNLHGDFPMLLSHSKEAPLGSATVGIKYMPSYGIDAHGAIVGRRGVATIIVCNLRDDAGHALSTEFSHVLPHNDQETFVQQFKLPQPPPPQIAQLLRSGATVWCTWEVLLCDLYQGYVIGNAVTRIPYRQPTSPLAGLR